MAVSIHSKLIDLLKIKNYPTGSLDVKSLTKKQEEMIAAKAKLPKLSEIPNIIYSLPLGYAGTFSSLPRHFERISRMATIIHLTPIGQRCKIPATSQKYNSPYAQTDARRSDASFHTQENREFNPDTGDEINADYAQLRNDYELTLSILYANTKSVRVLADMVLNHVPPDNMLYKKYQNTPNVFITNPEVHQFEILGKNRTLQVKDVWDDVIKINWPYLLDCKNRKDKSHIYYDFINYFKEVTEYYVSLGFDGMRFDAAHLIEPEILATMENHFMQEHTNVWQTTPQQIPFLYETLTEHKDYGRYRSSVHIVNDGLPHDNKPSFIAMSDYYYFILQTMANPQQQNWMKEQLKSFKEAGFIPIPYTATHDTPTLITGFIRMLAEEKDYYQMDDLSGVVTKLKHTFLISEENMKKAQSAWLMSAICGAMLGTGLFFLAGEEYGHSGRFTPVGENDPLPYKTYSVEAWRKICHDDVPLVDFRSLLSQLKEAVTLMQTLNYNFSDYTVRSTKQGLPELAITGYIGQYPVTYALPLDFHDDRFNQDFSKIMEGFQSTLNLAAANLENDTNNLRFNARRSDLSN